ncbi:MAG: hemerythrin domain-containing protein [Thiothrix sp.]|nr:hemerythrin domain-containing protein [Thiothrix sp.]HPQ95336.1 hemerythrin domain-containing protein [Thiolinea sp.]
MSNQNMQQLVQEHAECLLLADRLERVVRRGQADELATAVQWVREYHARELEPHLQHEEQALFTPLLHVHQALVPLCIQLGKEHGLLRTLAENISEARAPAELAEFARVLRSHTLLENEQLFPALEALFTPAQWDAVRNFKALGAAPEAARVTTAAVRHGVDPDAWLARVDAHFGAAGRGNGHIVLFPRYQPELVQQLAGHLGIAFFDYRQVVMAELRERADTLTLAQLTQTLRTQSQQQGLVCHNAEALLCVKPEAERRAWLRHLVETDWPHPVVVPLAVFQADAPAEAAGQVCDLELVRLPRGGEGRVEMAGRLPYDVS